MQLLICRKTKVFTITNRDGYMVDPIPLDSKKEIFSPVIPNPLAMEHSKLMSWDCILVPLWSYLSSCTRSWYPWAYFGWGVCRPCEAATCKWWLSFYRRVHGTSLVFSHDKHIYVLYLFQSVEPLHSPTTEATRRPENISKNRYANITACEFFLQQYCL